MSDKVIRLCKIGFFMANVCLLIGVNIINNIEQKRNIDKSVKAYLDNKHLDDAKKEGI